MYSVLSLRHLSERKTPPMEGFVLFGGENMPRITGSSGRRYYNNLTNSARYDISLRDYWSYAREDWDGSVHAFDSLLNNVGPGAHFFFFTSLNNYNGPWKSRLPEVFELNNSMNNLNAQSFNFDQKMQAILDLISGFKQFEADNEYKVFSEKITPLINANPTLYKNFNDTFKSGHIDYPKFMALLKILKEDINVVKSELSDLEAHMRKWDDAYKKAFSAAKEDAIKNGKYNQYGDDYYFNLANRAEIVESTRRRIEYEVSSVEKNLAEGVKHLKDLRKNNGRLESDIKKLGERMLKVGQTTMQGKDIAKELGTSINEQQLLGLYQKLNRIAKTYDIHMKDLLKKLDDDVSALEIGVKWGTSIGKYSSHDEAVQAGRQRINQLAEYLLTLISNDSTALLQLEQLSDKLNSKSKLHTRKSSKDGFQWAGLVKKRRELIIQALKTIKPSFNSTKALDELIAIEEDPEHLINIDGKYETFNIQKRSHFKKYIELLRQALRKHEIKDNNILPIIEELETILKSSEAQDRREIITITSESGGAFDLDNILDNTITIRLDNNFREDSITVGYLRYENNEDELINNSENIMNSASSALEKTKNRMYELHSKDKTKEDIYSELSKRNIKAGRTSREYDVRSTLEAARNIDAKVANTLAEELHIKDLQKVYDELQDLFIIEKSDKFSTTFNSFEYGFHGGSLGGQLEDQINNLNDMLNIGGITPIDANFLISAIMNAGPGMLGYGQKDAIETYLSAIASACMFTSGAQALEDYVLNVKQHIPTMSTTKIHLFQTNTLYVPLSYILSLMEEGLKKCFGVLKNEFKLDGTAGNKVTIYNPVNEANDKISTWYYHNGRSIYIGDWQATADAGLPKVHLDMAILGSFLDVLSQINSILNNMV